MSEPMISVIVPVYKVEKYLARCVDSILAQNFSDMEIILVDDGSPDRCGIICDAFAEKDSRVRVIHKENAGLSEARNTGIDAAVGKYLCFVDSDDFIDAEMLEVLYRLLTENEADMSICGVRNCSEGRVREQTPERPKEMVLTGVEGLKKTLEGKELPGSMCSKLIRREICRDHRFVKDKTYEDAIYTPQVFLRSEKVAVTTRSLYNYWHRADSITTKPFSEKSMDVVDAYIYTLEQVRAHCPDLEDVAMFRLYWAYFVVLDKMLVTPDYQKLPQYGEVKGFLKKNAWKVICCRYFTKARRISALALKLHVGLYRRLVQMQNKRMEVHE